MNTHISRARLAALPLALAAVFPLMAQSQTFSSLSETVVTATRVAQPLSDLLADVTIIDHAAIERSGAVALADVLARVPGIEFVRNGGPGTATNVYTRGAEARFTAVYIDGVRVDTQTTGGVSWEAIPLSQIDRVEVLRGPASSIYGSDAMGGVIQIFTRKGEGVFSPFIGFGIGSNASNKVEAGFGGTQGVWDYSFGLASENSIGFDSSPGKNPDQDGYRTQSLSVKLGFQISPTDRLEAFVLSNDLNSQYDHSSIKNRDDHNLRQLDVSGLNWQARWNDSYSTKFSITDSREQYETTPAPYQSLTNLRGYLFQNEYRQGMHLFTAAFERREDQLDNFSYSASNVLTALIANRSQDALALGYGLVNKKHTLQLNIRHDQDSDFGGQNTGSAAYGYAFTRQWRGTASVGTAFRVPTLFQRFGTSGLPTLKPEVSRNLEIGVHYTEGASSLGIVAYRNEVSNLITFLSKVGTCPNNMPLTKGTTPGCYDSINIAEYAGATISGQHRWGSINLHASLDVQNPRDLATDRQLTRRSRQHATFGVDTSIAGWSLGADAQLSGLRYDDAANTTVLPGYALLNLYAQTHLSKDWTLLARLDNATDTAYQLAGAFATPGRTFYLGVKWAPQ